MSFTATTTTTNVVVPKCTFCKVDGHSCNICPVLQTNMCNNCLRVGHTQKRCKDIPWFHKHGMVRGNRLFDAEVKFRESILHKHTQNMDKMGEEMAEAWDVMEEANRAMEDMWATEPDSGV